MARLNNQSAPNKSQDGVASKPSHTLSALAIIEKIFHAIAEAKHNKAHVEKFRSTTEQIIKALNGIDVYFIRNAEFYADLKETLCKIYYHVMDASTRKKWIKYMMAKKDQSNYEEIQKHVDNMVSRIVFSYAQRTKNRRNSPTPSSDENGCSHAGSACCCSDVSMDN